VLLSLNLFAQLKDLDTVFVTGNQKEAISQEGRERALKDISEGKVYIYNYGLIVRRIGTEKLEYQIDSLAKTYGFEIKLGGCSIPSWSDGYYEEVIKYLEKRNGIGWKSRFDNEVKILKDAFYSSHKE
jgi:hypothetical protein